MPVVATFYRFTPFSDPQLLRAPLEDLCAEVGTCGTILLAREGVNGTIAGSGAGIEAVLSHLRSLPGCAGLTARRSDAPAMPFVRMKVRIKCEIAALGRPDADPARRTGARVAPRDWNALIEAPDVAVIDTRNVYETAIGGFAGAIDPRLGRFGDFPAWWHAYRAGLEGRRIAMFCTGGIRCEKASSFLLGAGAAEVFQLEGGILGYLASVPPETSLWHGSCFVFDGRVALGPDLAPGAHVLCHACGAAVAPEDLAHFAWEPGVSCPACIGAYPPARRAGFRERQRQMRLAEARGLRHLGPG